MTIMAGRTVAEIIGYCRSFAEAQRKMAADAKGDRTYWHHFGLADLLEECARRLETPSPQSRVTPVNERGARIKGTDNELLADFRVYDEGNSVQIWAEVRERDKGFSGRTHEALQYLKPEEAMAFAAAFERCAIAALRSQTGDR